MEEILVLITHKITILKLVQENKKLIKNKKCRKNAKEYSEKVDICKIKGAFVETIYKHG
ncbi:hypothetical protein ANS017_25110 [Paraclostridium bifermentans]|nr:hypothetical protein ANS014_28440 [Paraclostridium bifermentans]GKZ08560.1 hypothetical protein ANS015_34430 [Paraclostridium bifermentans]GKZ11127.1 hypothetical protein ANS017_25110 [Paraclostridium bifermentans]